MALDSKSKRQRIRENVLTVLESKTNARRVSTQLEKDLERVRTFPTIHLIAGAERTLPTESYGNCMLAELELVTTVFVRAHGRLDEVQTELDGMIKEIEDALQADISCGGHAINTWLQNIDTDEGHWHPFAAAQLRFVVRYEYTLGDR